MTWTCQRLETWPGLAKMDVMWASLIPVHCEWMDDNTVAPTTVVLFTTATQDSMWFIINTEGSQYTKILMSPFILPMVWWSMVLPHCVFCSPFVWLLLMSIGAPGSKPAPTIFISISIEISCIKVSWHFLRPAPLGSSVNFLLFCFLD